MKKIPKRLGEILIEGEIVTKEQLKKALEIQRKEKRLLGEILVDLGYIAKEKLDLALVRQFGSRLGEILVRNKMINFEQLHKALERQRDVNSPLGEILIALGYISEESLLKSLSTRYGMPFIKLADYKVNVEALNKLPMELCRDYNVLPIDIKEGCLIVATATPEDIITEENMKAITGMPVKVVIALRAEIRDRISP